MKKTLIVIAIVIAALLGLLWGGQYFLNRKVDKALKEKVNEALGSNYNFDYSHSRINLFDNRAFLSGIEIRRTNETPEDWFISLERIEVKGFHWLSLLRNNRITLDSVLLINPDVHMNRWKQSEEDEQSEKPARTGSPPEVIIKGIRTEGGKFNYDPDGPEYIRCDFDFKLNDIDYAGKISDLIPLWYTSSIHLSGLEYQAADSMNIISAERIEMSKADSTLTIFGTSLKPNLGKVEYGNYYGWRKSRWQAEIDTIEIARPVNFTDSIGFIPRIRVAGVKSGFDKDLRLPWPDRVTKMPQPAIAGMDIPLQIDSIIMERGDLVINTIQDEGREAKIAFHQISASLTNIKNTKKDSTCFVFDAKGNLMGAAPIGLYLDYQYGKESPFKATGFIGGTNLNFADDFLRKAAGIKVASGQLTRLEFRMNGNEHGEGGHVDFHYQDLKLAAIDKETGETKVLLNLVAELARGFLFWKDNPNNGKFRRGEFYLERDVRKAFPSQWVDGLLEGILQTVSKVDPTKVRFNKEDGKGK